MSNKEIRSWSINRFRDNGGNCFSISMFMFSIAAFIFTFFSAVRLIFERVGWERFFSLSELKESFDVKIFWVLIVTALLPLLIQEWWIVNRIMLDIARGDDFVETRKYLNAHLALYGGKAILCTIDGFLRKVVMLVPAVLGGYGIHFIIHSSKAAQLSSVRLLILMLCIGFTGVWIGLFVRYIISVALVPYIMQLNPRAKPSEAVKLSKRLMEGNHTKYLLFQLSFLKFLPLLLFIYPFFIVYPYYKISKITYAEAILGDLWQDKLKATIKRWRRYSL